MANLDAYEQTPHYNVARITRKGDLVVSVEVANQKWIDDQKDDLYFYFVTSPDREGGHAVAGLRYNVSAGLFEQPAIVEPAEAPVKSSRKKS